MVIHYKCKSCGADMRYDCKTESLFCESCGREDRVELYDKTDDLLAEDQKKSSDKYICQSCGGELVTDEDTSATRCSFCGASAVLADRLSGSLCPSSVVPFMIGRKDAEEAFKKWRGKGLLTPKDFQSEERLKELCGTYVPFWLYDTQGQGELQASCSRVRSYSDSKYVYTETKHYQAYRKANLKYIKVPADASVKMDDKLMDQLEPYNYSSLKKFHMPYLAGFLAEKYHYTNQDLLPRIMERIKEYTNQYLKESVTGYTTVTVNRSSMDCQKVDAQYALLPVWVFRYDYNKKEYIFAMNGQTGKVVGSPPVSRTKILLWWFMITFVIFAVFLFIFWQGGIF